MSPAAGSEKTEIGVKRREEEITAKVVVASVWVMPGFTRARELSV
ncbi:MAG: hypothetical protein PHP28_03745 [Actinomycetota bacterium]|nr:hypothetical protein [Actinomycetota bacterium]MDD5666457.1 hypothetical protein [Actinomycetota bacterium]